jgi:DNA polymerase III psi subunit
VERIERALQGRLEKQPEEPVRLIVRIAGEMPQAEKRLTELGADVLRSFSLTKAVAVSCSAATALSLLKQPWVQSIEEDRQVTVQPHAEDDARAVGGKHD